MEIIRSVLTDIIIRKALSFLTTVKIKVEDEVKCSNETALTTIFARKIICTSPILLYHIGERKNIMACMDR